MNNKFTKLKNRVYEVIEVAHPNDILSKVCDIFLMTLILLNVALIIADTFNLPAQVAMIAHIFEYVSVAVFSVEYVVRVWTADLKFQELPPARARLKYMRSPMAVIDLVSLLPSLITFMSANLVVLRLLKIVRLLRVFKVNRYTSALRDIAAVFRRKASQLISSMMVVSLLMIIASVMMYDAEHDAQPEKFDNALSGMWWAIATLTTVGYGDIVPVTVLGKIMSAVIALLGIGLVAVPTGIITAGFSEQLQQKNSEKAEDKKNFCPYCGHKLDK